jgi:L-alanine-DL-glutamate epimerase-like enolase superfamily enzyme
MDAPMNVPGFASHAPGARVDRIDSRLMRVPLGSGRGGSGASEVDVVHVTVTDADGAQGTGFTYSLGRGGEALKAMIDGLLADTVVGSETDRWGRSWHAIWSASHRLGRGVAIPALSALDIAIWDLTARRAGLPLGRVIGLFRESVPVYGSGRATHQMSREELVAGAQSYVAEGYTAVKLRAGALGRQKDLERIRAVRAAVGDAVEIMVDCNERLSFADALWLGDRFREADVSWMEEPLASDDVAGHVRLASRLPVPIAVGEHLIGRFEFFEYIRQGAAAVVQPDAPLVGGITEWLRVAALADAANLSVSPHFLPELHVHLVAATRAATWLEHFPLIDDLLEETITVSHGRAAPPERPGHGMRWDGDALDKYHLPPA